MKTDNCFLSWKVFTRSHQPCCWSGIKIRFAHHKINSCNDPPLPLLILWWANCNKSPTGDFLSYGRLEVNFVALAKIKRPITIMKIIDNSKRMVGWSISEVPFRPFLSVRWAGCVAWGSIVGCCHTCKCPERPRRGTPTPNTSRLAAEHNRRSFNASFMNTSALCGSIVKRGLSIHKKIANNCDLNN